MNKYVSILLAGMLIGSLGHKWLRPSPCVPKVGSCYESADEPRSSELYQIEKVVKANDTTVTTVYTFPNDERFPKGKWAHSKGGLLDESSVGWFNRTRQPRECPW